MCAFLTNVISVKSRLDSPSGLSFTEFTYQLLQAYDYLTLHERHGCTVQLGGSDQMGNIQAGIDLIRRMHALSNPSQASPSSSASTAAPSVSSSGDDKKKKVPIDLELSKEDERAYGVTFQLLTTSSGEKFGKSAGNAIWLDPQLTSPFELYQVSRRLSISPRRLKRFCSSSCERQTMKFIDTSKYLHSYASRKSKASWLTIRYLFFRAPIRLISESL